MIERERPVSEQKDPEPTVLGGLAPLIAAVVAMVAVWGTVTYMKAHPALDAVSTETLSTQDEETFRRAYLIAALRASVGADEAERRAATAELALRHEIAKNRPGGSEALDAWIKDEIARLGASETRSGTESRPEPAPPGT